MIEPEVIVIPFTFGIPAVVIVIRMLLRHKEKMATLSRPAESTPLLEARLERVEQALDAIAVEMERVGEGQRFLTKILSDRPQALAQPAVPAVPAVPAPRVNTPH